MQNEPFRNLVSIGKNLLLNLRRDFTQTNRFSLRLYLSLVLIYLSGAAISQANAADLINGGSVNGSIDFAGEQDTWTLDVTEGERLILTLVDVDDTALRPKMTLYAPDGSYATSGVGNRVAEIYNYSASQTGTYTLVVEDATSTNDQVGAYEIHLAKGTGANEHGQLVNGGSVTENITVGDLDSWTFDVTAGERLILTMVDTADTTLRPLLTLYAPDGSYATSGVGDRVA